MGIYNIGIILRELRKKKHFSQKQLAEGICSIEYISKIENGKKTPSSEITSKLLHRLGENPDLFFTSLSSMDNELYTEHRFELEKLLGASQYNEARAYIAFLEKEHPFYTSDEPHQYIMGKRSVILQNQDKKFDESYDLAYRSILLTKPDFTVDTMEQYEFYSINELWSLLYMASALYWKETDLKLGNSIQPSIDLASFVLSHLGKGYLHPSMTGTLYASAAFYLGKYLRDTGSLEEARAVSAKGFQFITKYYNQIIELLGKILTIQADCILSERRQALNSPITKETIHKDFSIQNFFDSFSDPELLYGIGATLLILSANEETLHQYCDLYLGIPYREI